MFALKDLFLWELFLKTVLRGVFYTPLARHMNAPYLAMLIKGKVHRKL